MDAAAMMKCQRALDGIERAQQQVLLAATDLGHVRGMADEYERLVSLHARIKDEWNRLDRLSRSRVEKITLDGL